MQSDDAAMLAVRAVIERYADATYRADLETLRGLFHPSASMTGYLGDALIAGGPEAFFEDLGSHPSMADTNAPYKFEIPALDVSGRTASATLEESGFFGSGRFIDRFHLLYVDGEWKIVSKTFETIP